MYIYMYVCIYVIILQTCTQIYAGRNVIISIHREEGVRQQQQIDCRLSNPKMSLKKG